MISSKIGYIAGLLISFFLLTPQAGAQTCRINSGTSNNGTPSYREVYEYDYVTDKPTFPGGDRQLVNFINEIRQYPADAYKRGVQGRVLCSFVVNIDGSISDVMVLKGVERTLDREAVRIITKMPEWIPGKIDGKNVPVRVIWPVAFRK